MNKKIITIIFTLSTMLFLVGCSFTNNESNGSDKNYTYNDLDENQKEIIDNVYAELGDWGYTYEPSAIPASKIKFFYEDSKLIFVVNMFCTDFDFFIFFCIYKIITACAAYQTHIYLPILYRVQSSQS